MAAKVPDHYADGYDEGYADGVEEERERVLGLIRDAMLRMPWGMRLDMMRLTAAVRDGGK